MPNENRIEYDKRSFMLTTGYCGEAPDKDRLCALYSPYNALKLITDAKSGEIVGCECHIGELEKLPRAGFEIKSYIVGCVNALWDSGKFLAGCNYLIDFNCLPSYDSGSGFIAFGAISDEFMSVRICDNLYLSFDGESNLRTIAIKL